MCTVVGSDGGEANPLSAERTTAKRARLKDVQSLQFVSIGGRRTLLMGMGESEAIHAWEMESDSVYGLIGTDKSYLYHTQTGQHINNLGRFLCAISEPASDGSDRKNAVHRSVPTRLFVSCRGGIYSIDLRSARSTPSELTSQSKGFSASHNSSAAPFAPFGMAYDRTRNALWVTDNVHSALHRIDLSGRGSLHTVWSQTSLVRLDFPAAICMDRSVSLKPDSVLYICCAWKLYRYEIDTSTFHLPPPVMHVPVPTTSHIFFSLL